MYYYFVLFAIFCVFVTANIIISNLIGSVRKILDVPQENATENASINSSTTARMNSQSAENDVAQSKGINFLRGSKFEIVCFGIYVVYLDVISLDHYQIDQQMANILNILNLIFVLLLIVEVVLRFVAYKKEFFMNRWNIYDLVVVIMSIIGENFHFTHHLKV